MTAKTAKTAPAPLRTRSAPETTGPTKRESPSSVPEAALEAVSSCGVSASSGRIEWCTGRVSVTAEAATAASG